jgi:uncharacterized protein (DUF2237 family)
VRAHIIAIARGIPFVCFFRCELSFRCAILTQEFLNYTRARGNDLTTARGARSRSHNLQTFNRRLRFVGCRMSTAAASRVIVVQARVFPV